ncbi:hypothetical protein [Caldisalinibacter kiritimatiensis]|uniref:Uncharacterized protein n=1 Tax=Caldisalinibacter kiritimatiensis TaxID=1304284 RepID=R1ASS1_9FIRM|nr:hypothetical protein [Caldisalinibacter kiritimatiensis]EOD00203.1 hypothetical protein L21TH_1748 [Caldisalinibacter kiritimatiensis]
MCINLREYKSKDKVQLQEMIFALYNEDPEGVTSSNKKAYKYYKKLGFIESRNIHMVKNNKYTKK